MDISLNRPLRVVFSCKNRILPLMNSLNLVAVKKIHFIGIGGIGISAIARMMLQQGKSVTGSDNSISEITEALKKEGATIFNGHSKENIGRGVDLVVYTAAIPKDNVELEEAKIKNIPTISYSEVLGLVSKDKKVIAVSGTHGKTTVTAMIAEVLIDAGISPTIVIGSLLRKQYTNFVAGTSEYFLTEADEYKKSFLSLSPYILIINNIDLDHLDFYKDLSDIQNAFIELVRKIPKEGVLICDINHPHLLPVVKEAKCRVIDYKAQNKEGLKLQVPGEHNRENAKVAIATATVLGVSHDKIISSLNAFAGAWRRFEYKGQTAKGAIVYDDYAHNPQKVEAVILGAKEMFPNKRIVAVFQPHLYSRTKLLLKDFAKSLSRSDIVFLAPIYGAREVLDPSISSDMLAEEIRKFSKEATSIESLDKICNVLIDNLQDGDVCILIGAGDIYTVAPKLVV